MNASLYPRYSKEEFARRGNEIYERDVRPHLRSQDDGKFVAIDIETGTYEVDADEIVASRRLLIHHPEAQIWFRQVGASYTHRFESPNRSRRRYRYPAGIVAPRAV